MGKSIIQQNILASKKQPKTTPRNQPNGIGKNREKSTKKTSTMNLTKLTNPYSSNSAIIVTPR